MGLGRKGERGGDKNIRRKSQRREGGKMDVTEMEK